jgi:hypothetical protein
MIGGLLTNFDGGGPCEPDSVSIGASEKVINV